MTVEGVSRHLQTTPTPYHWTHKTTTHDANNASGLSPHPSNYSALSPGGFSDHSSDILDCYSTTSSSCESTHAQSSPPQVVPYDNCLDYVTYADLLPVTSQEYIKMAPSYEPPSYDEAVCTSSTRSPEPLVKTELDSWASCAQTEELTPSDISFLLELAAGKFDLYFHFLPPGDAYTAALCHNLFTWLPL